MRDYLLVTVAGFAVEVGYGLGTIVPADCRGADFDVVRDVLQHCEYLRLAFDAPGGAPSSGRDLDHILACVKIRSNPVGDVPAFFSIGTAAKNRSSVGVTPRSYHRAAPLPCG